MGNESINGHKIMKTSPLRFNFLMPTFAPVTCKEMLALQSQSTPMPSSTPGWPDRSFSPPEFPTLFTLTGPSLGGFVPNENWLKRMPLKGPGTEACNCCCTSSFINFSTDFTTKGQISSTAKFSHCTSAACGPRFFGFRAEATCLTCAMMSVVWAWRGAVWWTEVGSIIGVASSNLSGSGWTTSTAWALGAPRQLPMAAG
mmetsp:Transcript_21501/g.61445  ORF Transcript_21501/g.61445 Transcript_21501/m.61445 type:complete len:200 (+) Transcript_21501:1377-1976(+)